MVLNPYSFTRLEVITKPTLGTDTDFKAGEITPLVYKTNTIATASDPVISFAVGSYYDTDNVGGLLFALKNPSITPGINARYVSKFYKVDAQEPRKEIYLIGSDATNTSDFKFYKGQVYQFYLKVDNGIVLDTLGKSAVRQYTVDTGCFDKCADPCLEVEVDSVWVFKQLADQINADKIVNQFVKAQALNNGALTADNYEQNTDEATVPTLKGGMRLTGAFVDLATGDCTFSTGRAYSKQPVHIVFTSFMPNDLEGCKGFNEINTIYEKNSKLLQSGVVAEGFGEGVLREYILSERYKELHFSSSPYVREAEKSPVLGVVDRGEKYVRYYLEWNVPYFMNQTNTFNNNRFIYCFAAPESVGLDAFETFVTSWLTAHGSPVKLEDKSGVAQTAAVADL